jgi:hypothetical protein
MPSPDKCQQKIDTKFGNRCQMGWQMCLAIAPLRRPFPFLAPNVQNNEHNPNSPPAARAARILWGSPCSIAPPPLRQAIKPPQAPQPPI